MAFELPQSFRDERWAAFECALSTWLETPDGRFAVYWAERERREASGRELTQATATETLAKRVSG